MLRQAMRTFRAGAAGAAAWWIGLNFIFGSAQRLLADPALQSRKMMAIYDLQPPARIIDRPWLLPIGILIVALVQALVFALIRRGLPAGRFSGGLVFGGVAWGLLVPWFEFYLPWSLMLEPTALVLIEMLCWAAVLTLAGLAISFSFGCERAPRNMTRAETLQTR